jgi:hypothetical protein
LNGPASGSDVEGLGGVEIRTTDVTPARGGVMTDEVGVVTGELTLRTEVDQRGGMVHLVRYRDADEWYVVTGSRSTLAGAGDIDAAHAAAVILITRDG